VPVIKDDSRSAMKAIFITRGFDELTNVKLVKREASVFK
jgi:hypothetical protein